VPDIVTHDADRNSNNTTTDMAVSSHVTILDDMLDVPREATKMDILATAEPDLIALEYNMVDLDIPGAQNRAQPDIKVKELIEVNALCTTSQYDHPGSLGSWQVVNWPKMDSKELLQGWNWVFQNRY
jgi:uncharacterized radical SAM superfamily protein